MMQAARRIMLVAAVLGLLGVANGQALTGLVRSAEEGPMEGVLVSAQMTKSSSNGTNNTPSPSPSSPTPADDTAFLAPISTPATTRCASAQRATTSKIPAPSKSSPTRPPPPT